MKIFPSSLRSLLATASLIICASAGAAEKDWLSGDYDYIIPEEAKLALAQQGQSIPRLTVTKTDDGWELEQLSGKIATKPIDPAFYEKVLPDYGTRHEFQCLDSAEIIFCHVKPGTILNNHQFTANTGYFMLRLGFGPVELTKAKPDIKTDK